MKTRIACLLFAIVTLLVSARTATGQPVTRPNIVFLFADDLGYGDLGCYGQKLIETPHLDRLAVEGMRFTRFYAGSTVCAPSRSVLMTGLHLGHTRVRGNARGGRRQMLYDADVTVAEVLRGAGYATGLVGKWGLGLPGDEGVPSRQGFDHFFGFLSQYRAHQHFPDYVWRNDEKVTLPNVVIPVGKEGGGYPKQKEVYIGDMFVREACEFIERNRERPFFLYFASTLPHANNEAYRMLGNGAEAPDLGVYAGKPWPEPEKGYAAMVSQLDAGVGAILRRLETLGLAENTLVIFASDNGPEHKRQTGYDPEFFNSGGPLRGVKRQLTEGGIRVPFIARWPGRIQPGSTSAHVSYLGDMMTTLAELAGATPPPGLDSISIVPTLLGREGQRRHEYLYWEFYEGGASQAVLFGERWKAIREKAPGGPIQLYDLSADVSEERDVADAHPELVTRMVETMREAHVPNEHWKFPVASKH